MFSFRFRFVSVVSSGSCSLISFRCAFWLAHAGSVGRGSRCLSFRQVLGVDCRGVVSRLVGKDLPRTWMFTVVEKELIAIYNTIYVL